MSREIFEVTKDRFHLQDPCCYILQGTWPKEAKMRAMLDGSEIKSEIQRLEVVSALERFKDPDLMRGERITAAVHTFDKSARLISSTIKKYLSWFLSDSFLSTTLYIRSFCWKEKLHRYHRKTARIHALQCKVCGQRADLFPHRQAFSRIPA